MPGSHHHFSSLETSNTWDTFYKQNMLQIAPEQVWPIRTQECEDEWRKGESQECWNHSGRPQQRMHWHTQSPGNQNNSQNTKNVQEELKPTHPAVKYSLGTGENKWQQLCTTAPVKLNRMATAKERVVAQGPFVQKHHRFCHFLWHLNSCFSCIHNANPYRLSAFSESTSEYFKPFKKFCSYCSTVRRLIN